MKHATTALPRHDVVAGPSRAIEVGSLIAAPALLIINIGHTIASGVWQHWWSPLVIVAAALAADFISGLVHWAADTWFSASMPVIGRRFLYRSVCSCERRRLPAP